MYLWTSKKAQIFLTINQNTRQKIRRKRKRKENFSSEIPVHIDDEPAKSRTKTAIKCTFSLGKKER